MNLHFIRVGRVRRIKFYGNLPIELGEVGAGELIGNLVETAQRKNFSTLTRVHEEMNVVATTHLQTFYLPKENYFDLIITAPAVRKCIQKIVSINTQFPLSTITRQLQEKEEWDTYKRNLLLNALPPDRFIHRKSISPRKRIFKKAVQDENKSPHPPFITKG